MSAQALGGWWWKEFNGGWEPGKRIFSKKRDILLLWSTRKSGKQSGNLACFGKWVSKPLCIFVYTSEYNYEYQLSWLFLLISMNCLSCNTFHAAKEIRARVFNAFLSISLVRFLVQILSRGLAIAFLLQQTVWFRSAAAYHCYISEEMKCLWANLYHPPKP